MEKISRRKMLLTGGALGAAGAIGMATPAGAKSLWTWKPSGSIAGTGTGADPKWVWDDETDPLVASLQERGDVPRVNQLLRQWRYNSQPLPAGLPTDVVDYINHARQLPAWTDQAKLAQAFDFYRTRGLYLGLTYGFGSGMMSTVIPNEARAVYYSKGGANMRDRITKTAKLGHDIGDPNAFKPDGDMIVTCVKTRLTHAAVRHLLPRSPQYPAPVGPNGLKPVPISQADIMVTWHSLATTANRYLTKWNLRIPKRHSDGYLHVWQVTASMLGVKDEYIPATWAAADSQAQQVLDPILAATPEGIDLADILLDMAQLDLNNDGIGPLRVPLNALTRYMLGDEITDALQIPRDDFWDELVAWAWPRFVAIREGALLLPLPPNVLWFFDEILRNGVLFYLGEGQDIFIEMPTANRESFPA
jgi:hypothetical protein